MKIRRNQTPKVYLQPGEMLGDVRYRVDSLWEDNDITITYRGYDTFRKKEVVIRELFPRTIMTRDYDKNYEIVCKKLSDENVFETMKDHMIARAKKLIKLYPVEGIANVLTYFEEHGTVYVIEEVVNGQTLKEYFFKRHSAKFKVEDIMKQMSPVIDILNGLHKKGLIHGCLCPENIVITPDKKIVLLQMMNPIDDLAHECLGNIKIRKDGYAPVELFLPQAKRTTQTDLYEVAAIFYYYVTGQEVPAYYMRINEAEVTMQPADTQTIVMDFQSDAIMKALGVYDFERYATLDEFRKALCPDDLDMDALDDEQTRMRYQMHKPGFYIREERSRRWYVGCLAAIIIIGLVIMVPRMFYVGKDEQINHFYKKFVAATEYEQCRMVSSLDRLAREKYTNDYYDMDMTKDTEELSQNFVAKYYDFQLKKYVTADRVNTQRTKYEYLKIDYRKDHIVILYLSDEANWTKDLLLPANGDGSYQVIKTYTDENGKERTENLNVRP